MTDDENVTPLPLLVQVADLIDARLGELEATLRDELHEAVAEIHGRIDAVHARALRELTRLTGKGN